MSAPMIGSEAGTVAGTVVPRSKSIIPSSPFPSCVESAYEAVHQDASCQVRGVCFAALVSEEAV